MPETTFLVETKNIGCEIIVNTVDATIIHTGPQLKKFKGSTLAVLRTWLNKISQGQYKIVEQKRLEGV